MRNADPATLARDVARVLQAMLESDIDAKKALNTIATIPIRSFDGRTALEMIESGRARDVVDYVQSFSGGWVG